MASATEWTILGLLRDEIEGRIYALTPHGYPGDAFKARSEDQRRAPLEKQLVTRTFEVGKAEQVPKENVPEEFGTSTRELVYHLPIRIVYPTYPQDWRDAAQSDYAQIRQDIDNNYSGMPSGVQMRFILGQPTFEAIPEDPFEIMTLTLFAELSAEG